MEFKLKVTTTCEKLKVLVESKNYGDDVPRLFVTIKVLCDCIEARAKSENKWDGTALEENTKKFLRACAVLTGLLDVDMSDPQGEALRHLDAMKRSYLSSKQRLS